MARVLLLELIHHCLASGLVKLAFLLTLLPVRRLLALDLALAFGHQIDLLDLLSVIAAPRPMSLL